MATFVDTSALYALLSRTDAGHEPIAAEFRRLLERSESLLTHNYVLVETTALAQHRLGLAAVAALRNELLPVIQVEWVERGIHDVALAATISSRRREVSLVDRVSFEVMRQRGVKTALALDEDFAAEGFTLIPAG